VTPFLIPLENVPQVFEIALGGTNYLMTSKYNSADEGGWVLDLQDAVTNEYLACNIPLITGADLLEGLEYLGIAGPLVVFTDGDELAVPTLENLGVESNLYLLSDVAA